MNIKRLRKLLRDFEEGTFDAGVTAGRGNTRELAVDLAYARDRRKELMEFLLAEATKDASKMLAESRAS